MRPHPAVLVEVPGPDPPIPSLWHAAPPHGGCIFSMVKMGALFELPPDRLPALLQQVLNRVQLQTVQLQVGEGG